MIETVSMQIVPGGQDSTGGEDISFKKAILLPTIFNLLH